MADLTGMMQAAAGSAGGGGEYIEDVFSNYLYTGNGATNQTITNNIDLSTEGGLVWIKQRNGSTGHFLSSSGSSFASYLSSNTTTGNTSNSSFFSVTTSGFSLTGAGGGFTNNTSDDYVSWTFRKAPKFFDVVTWTGTGVNRTVAHNLGSVPGCIMVKRTDTTGNWQVYHRANTANPETDYLVLNDTAATADSDTRWNDTAPTDAVFSLGTEATVNASGGTYVAYLWAHNDGGFGDDGLQNVVTCGSYVGNGSTQVVTLGYEPQLILYKGSSVVSDWTINDNMRGVVTGGTDAILRPNSSSAEYSADQMTFTATGFQAEGSGSNSNSSGQTYIYIAIRRGPMKTPTAGTEVFGLNARTGTGANATVTGSAGVSDAVLVKNRGSAVASLFAARLTGTNYLVTSTTAAQVAAGTTILQANPWDVMDGVKVGTTSTITNASGNTFINYLFSRAPGFFDVVCYTGTGSATTFTHNLGVVPEMMIVKLRTGTTQEWAVYHSGMNGGVTPQDFYMNLNTTSAEANSDRRWNDTAPTSTVFTVGIDDSVNYNGGTLVAYLFASLAGVSDIGTYTGNGTSVSVTTGFQPRFILVKRTDSTGNWIVGDSARGLVAGDDPFLELNTSDAEVTNEDWVDVSGTGFTINETAANANVSTATYLYLAIS